MKRLLSLLILLGLLIPLASSAAAPVFWLLMKEHRI